ncbi:hypothetical protein HDV02_003872 [Globomyces sp. JEL0801]|nr:hypothetical protein HDV02_003872 [Globomyces sp. JEL0801]
MNQATLNVETAKVLLDEGLNKLLEHNPNPPEINVDMASKASPIIQEKEKRIPSLPYFKSNTEQASMKDPVEWTSLVTARLEGNYIPVHRWFKAAICYLNHTDGIAIKTIVENPSDIVDLSSWNSLFCEPFINHHDSSAMKQSLLRDLMCRKRKAIESTQEFVDRFAADLKRLKTKDDNNWAIEAFLIGVGDKVRIEEDRQCKANGKELTALMMFQSSPYAMILTKAVIL